jgi:hypothetical protein
MPAISATPRLGPDRDDEPLVVEGERLRPPAPELRIQVPGHRLALLQRHLRQRWEHMPGARIHRRGKVAGDIDLRMVQHAQVTVDLDAAIVTGRQPRIGHKIGRPHPTRPDEHATLHQLAVLEPEAVLGRGGDRRVGCAPELQGQKGS